MLKITFLGTGTSHGVPVIACDCPTCTSTDPRNHRTRCSILVEQNGASVLVDAAELRLQAIRAASSVSTYPLHPRTPIMSLV